MSLLFPGVSLVVLVVAALGYGYWVWTSGSVPARRFAGAGVFVAVLAIGLAVQGSVVVMPCAVCAELVPWSWEWILRMCFAC